MPQTSLYPDRPLTAVRRWPFLPRPLSHGIERPLFLHPPASIPCPTTLFRIVLFCLRARCHRYAPRSTFYLIVRRAYPGPPARFSHSDNERPWNILSSASRTSRVLSLLLNSAVRSSPLKSVLVKPRNQACPRVTVEKDSVIGNAIVIFCFFLSKKYRTHIE